MKIVIQTLDFNIDSELTRYIENALGKPVSASAVIRHAEVILYEESLQGAKKKCCSIRAVLSDNSYLVSNYSDSYEGAILVSVNELVEKLIRDFPDPVNGNNV